MPTAAARDERYGARDGFLDRRRRRAVRALDQHPKLVEHGAVAARREHVQQRLRGKDLADRGGERRPAGLGADAHDLGQRVEQAVAGSVRTQMNVERGDEACGKVVFGGPNRDARRDGRDRLVADVLVDEIAGFPQRRGVDTGLAAETVERVDERLARRHDGESMPADRSRWRSGRRRLASPRRRSEGLSLPHPARRGRRAGRSPCRCVGRAPRSWCGRSASVGSLRMTRVAPSAGSCFARSTSASISPSRPAL